MLSKVLEPLSKGPRLVASSELHEAFMARHTPGFRILPMPFTFLLLHYMRSLSLGLGIYSTPLTIASIPKSEQCIPRRMIAAIPNSRHAT